MDINCHIWSPELEDDGLVEEESDVLFVEEGLDLGEVALLGALAVPGLPRVDPFQDAESPEVLWGGDNGIYVRYERNLLYVRHILK